MTLTLEIPAEVEQVYRDQARARGLNLDELVREVLIANQPKSAVAEQGLGLFGSPEDSALLDEVVAMAYEERRRPTGRF